MKSSNFITALATVASLALVPMHADAQAWPARPIRIVVPAGPGGAIDAIAAARMAWGRDGMLYVTIGGANEPASQGPLARSQGGVAQDPTRHGGKVLRLKDDGTPAPGADMAGKVERPRTFFPSASVRGSPIPIVPQSRS